MASTNWAELAVHDRDFGAVDFDQRIVDAKAAKRSKQMLDRRHGGAVAVAKHRAQRYAGHVPLIGTDLGAFGIAVGEKKA